MKIASFLLLALLVGAVTSAASAQNVGRFVKDEVLVKFKANLSNSARAEAVQDADVVERLADTGWVRVKLRGSEAVGTAVGRLSGRRDIEAVQPNFYYQLMATPNDPEFPLAGMYGLSKISAPQAWDITTGSSSVVVANIDTGMRYTHQDLAPNAWSNPGEVAGNGVDDDNNGLADDVYGWDFFYNDPNPIDDAGGHGTHTAGTIGAAGNNLLNVVGVNWNVKIMPIKIYSPNQGDSTSAMLVNAYNYVRMMKLRGVNIRVTNNSYGGCGEARGYDQATKDALDAMGEAGILNVFAAGNANVNNDVNPSGSYPSVYTSPSVLSVAASTSTDAKAGFSNYGPVSVDLAAPGQSILSTWNSSDSATATLSGTSMAAPHVAGAAALLSAYNPNLSAASLKATLMNTVDVLPGWASFVKTGGRLNVRAALQNQTVCTFAPSSSAVTAGTKGGYYSVSVAAAQNCDYSVRSDSNWIKVSGPDALSGNGVVTFRVRLNPTVARTGTILIGGQTVTVTQSRS